MGWVVKSWRIEALSELVGSAAARELADATAYLTALETFGVQTLEQVSEQRSRLRSPRLVIPEPRASVRVHRPARRARATLYDSPLAELFAAAGRRA